MVGPIVLTYQRKRISSRDNELNESLPLEIPASKSSADFDTHISVAQNMTRECGIYWVNSAEEVGENLLQSENVPTQFHAQHTEHDKITQDSGTLEDTEKSSGLEKMSQRNKASASGTNNMWNPTLLTYCRRSKQNNKKSMPDTEVALISKKIKVDDDPPIKAESDPSAAVQIIQNSVTCEAKTSVFPGQINVQDKDHANRLTVKPRGSPISNQNPGGTSTWTTASLDVDYDDLARTSGVHLSLDLIHEMTKMANETADFGAGVVGDKVNELSDSEKLNYLKSFPESRINNTTSRVNAIQKESAMVPEDGWHQFKPAAVQSSRLYNVLQRPKRIDGFGSTSSFYDWSVADVNSSFHSLLPSWDPNPERMRNYDLMSLLPVTWSEVELDSLWVGVRRHGRGNWEAMLKDPKLQFVPGKTPQDLAQRWGVEHSRLLQGSHGNSIDLSCHRVQARPYERNGHIQCPVANTAAVAPYSCFRNSSMDLFNPYGGEGMPRVDYSSGTNPVNVSLSNWNREPALLALRPSQPRYGVPCGHHFGTSQQPGFNKNSFGSSARQAEIQSYRRDCSANPPPFIGHVNAGTSEHYVDKDVVIRGGASPEKTVYDEFNNKNWNFK